SLIAISVASSLPAASSAPVSRHGAHSLLGSASHDGFGRLPAMEVGNMRWLAPSAWPFSCRMPTIEPIVAREQPFAAKGAQHAVAGGAGKAAEVIDPPVAPGGTLGAGGARLAVLLVAAHSPGRIIRRIAQALGQHEGILDRHRGALREERQHRVGSV